MTILYRYNIPLPQFALSWRWNSLNSWSSVFWKCIRAIMHYRAGIVRCLQMVYFVQAVLQKIIFHATNDVTSVDFHVFITICSRLLMPKPCIIQVQYYNQKEWWRKKYRYSLRISNIKIVVKAYRWHASIHV